MRLVVVAVVLCVVAGCGGGDAPADASGMDAHLDAGAPVATCADALTAVAATSCVTECSTDVPCAFTSACARPGCPFTTISCRLGHVFIYVSGVPCDTGPPSRDAGDDATDANVAVVHTCDDARSMLAGRDCRFGCDAGSAPCDFVGECCVQPSVFVGCAGGRVITTAVGDDTGPCDWDASLDGAAGDGG